MIINLFKSYCKSLLQQGERWSKAWPVAIQHGEKCKKCLQIIANKAGQLKSVSEAWVIKKQFQIIMSVARGV